jgi:hypothetical protein
MHLLMLLLCDCDFCVSNSCNLKLKKDSKKPFAGTLQALPITCAMFGAHIMKQSSVCILQFLRSILHFSVFLSKSSSK